MLSIISHISDGSVVIDMSNFLQLSVDPTTFNAILALETVWGTSPWVLTIREEPFLIGLVHMWVSVATQVGLRLFIYFSFMKVMEDMDSHCDRGPCPK